MDTNNDRLADGEFQEETRRFLGGRMSPEQRARYEASIQADAAKREELQFAANLNRALRAQELMDVHELIKNSMPAQSSAPAQSVARGRRWWWWGGSALLLGILAFSAWTLVVQHQRAQQLQALGQQNLIPLEVVLFVGADTDARLRTGLDAYEAQQYEEAIRRLGAYYEQSGDLNGGLYLGVSYLMNHQPQEASDWLGRVMRQAQEPAAESARWYLVLAYIQLEDTARALELLQNWPPQGICQIPAQALLKSLEPLK